MNTENKNKFYEFIKNINTYDEFIDKLSDIDSNNKKGLYFEMFSYYLFELDPRYVYQIKRIWMYTDIPMKIKKKLNLPDKDKGIDLLWKTKEDEYYPVQSKFRTNPKNPVTWTELSTFLASLYDASSIKGGVFITNQLEINNKISGNSKIIKLYGETWNDLPNNFFKNIRKLLKDKEIVSQVKITPKDFQKPIIENIVKYFNKDKDATITRFNWDDDDADSDNTPLKNRSRCILNAACGTGKTLMALFIKQKLKAKRTLIAVPSLNLLSQLFREWVVNIKDKDTKFLLIGSNSDTSGDLVEANNDLLTTTDPKEIKKWYLKHTTNDNSNPDIVVITTYQSANKISKKCEFDLGIFDEAHRTIGVKDSIFSYLLYDDNVKIKKRLFMTATPKFYKNNSKDDTEDVICMKNKELYGDIANIYSIDMALENKMLTPYEILHIYCTNKEFVKYYEDNKLIKCGEDGLKKASSQLVSAAIMLLKGMYKYDYKHVVTYHSSIKKAREFASILESIRKPVLNKKINISSVDGTDSVKKRMKYFKEFKEATRSILCTSKILQEGVNIPVIDCIMFISDKKSVIDIVQSVGRSLRLYPGKKKAYILIPTFLDSNDELDSKFKNIMTVLKALIGADKSLYEYFRTVYNGKKTSVSNKFKNVGLLTDVDIAIKVNITNWIKDLKVNIFKNVDGWMVKYDMLKKWIKKNDKLPNKRSKNKNEATLGLWCSRQRMKYKKINRLKKHLIEKLERLSGWYWKKKGYVNITLKSFGENYSILKEFVKQNNRLPSHSSKIPMQKSLAKWCCRQRKKYIDGLLPSSKSKQLKSINYWYWKNKPTFEESLKLVNDFVKDKSKIPSAASKDKDERKLGKWCDTIRQSYKKGKISDIKKNKLNKIKLWYWRGTTTFENSLKEVKNFANKYNKLPFKTSKDHNEAKLGSWCATQRIYYNKNKLSKKQINDIEKIPKWWWSYI